MDTGTRRFVTVVVVILVVLAGLVGALLYIWGPIAPDEPREDGDGWMERPDFYLVSGDVTLSDWDVHLDKSVLVTWGSDLTIVDSRIMVPLEKLALGAYDDWVAFYVDFEGSLTFKRSEIVIDADPRLDDAWVCNKGYYGEVPHFWRAVDLREATAPALEMDVKAINGSPVLAVAAQVGPDADLELLDFFGYDELGSGEWVHVEVPLEDLVGTTPRLVVFVYKGAEHSMMVRDARVLDGDGPLAADPFLTGDLGEDGWYVEAFEPFAGCFHFIQGLIMSEGDVRIEESTVTAAPGIDRYSNPYRPVIDDDHPGYMSKTLSAASLGAEINVTIGQLSILDSEVSYVPCMGWEAIVEVRGSTFVGDDEMLTLFDCSGAVEGCTFEFDAGTTDREARSSDDVLWQLAIERVNPTTGVTVDDCSFAGIGSMVGMGTGLHTTGSEAIASGCSFDGLGLGYWVHEGPPYRTWEDVDSAMSFGDDCRSWFMETRETRLDLDGPGANAYSSRGSWEPLELLGGPELPFGLDALVSNHKVELAAPVRLARPGSGATTMGELTIAVDPGWADRRFVTFDPWKYDNYVWFEERTEERSIVDFYPFFGPGSSTDLLQVDLVGFVADTREFDDYRIDLRLDGEVLAGGDQTVDDLGYYMFVNLTAQVAMPAGVHHLTFELVAKYLRTQSMMRLGVHTTKVVRLDEGLAGWDFDQMMDNDSALLMLDPGVEQEGICLLLANESRVEHFINVVAGEGSRAVFETVEGWDRASAFLYAHGAGEVVVGDVEAVHFRASVNGTGLTLAGDMDVEWNVDLNIVSAQARITGGVRTEMFEVYIVEDAGLAMEGCELIVDDMGTLWSVNSTMTLDGCRFSRPRLDDYSLGLNVMMFGHSTLALEGCTFEGVPVDVNIQDVNASVDVTGCEFVGAGSYLFLLGIQYWGEPYESITLPSSGEVSGNVFSGEGAGLVFDPLARDGFLGRNQFVQGALALTFHTPEVAFEGLNTSDGRYNATTLGGRRFLASGVYEGHQDWRTDWYQFLLDVTDDPLDAGDPGLVPVAVMDMFSPGNWRGVVTGFAEVPLAADGFTVTIIDWPQLRGDMRALYPEIDSGSNWWIDGGQ